MTFPTQSFLRELEDVLVTLCALRVTWDIIGTQSCLSALLPLTEGVETDRLQPTELSEILKALGDNKNLFKNSTAHLYTPKIEEIKNCTHKFFSCFLMEMKVILHEDNPHHEKLKMINTSLEGRDTQDQCEMEELTESSVFFERMTNFLQKLTIFCK